MKFSIFHLWSCRELNPGPTAFPQDFSVRSSLCLYLDLPGHANKPR